MFCYIYSLFCFLIDFLYITININCRFVFFKIYLFFLFIHMHLRTLVRGECLFSLRFFYKSIYRKECLLNNLQCWPKYFWMGIQPSPKYSSRNKISAISKITKKRILKFFANVQLCLISYFWPDIFGRNGRKNVPLKLTMSLLNFIIMAVFITSKYFSRV